MEDVIAMFIGLAVAGLLALASLCWFVILPTVGLLYLVGFLT